MGVRKKLPVACLLSLALLGAPGKLQTSPQARDAAVPFRAGERLDYRVGWQNFLTAATARLQVLDRRPFYGRAAWHLRAQARTVDPVRLLYPLDDQFDSYTDTLTLVALQYETYLREPNKNEDAVVRMGSEALPAVGDGPSVRVPAGTCDPLGAFYVLRAHDWERSPETRMPVYDGKKLYELRARRSGDAQTVSTPAGTFAAVRIELRVLERGRMLEETRFQLWLAQNAARTPVLMEAELPFGEFRVELTGVR